MTSKQKTNKDEVYYNKKIVRTITELLTEIINEQKNLIINRAIIEKQKKICFYSSTPSIISIQSYIERLCKFTHCELA